MGRSKGLVLLAGAALSLTGASAAMAQQASNDEVRAVVSEMLADAESRTSLLAGGDAGHDGRFFIASDGFRLNVGGLVQIRYMMNVREDNDVAGPFQDDFTHGFQLRRVKVDFNGELNRDWFYRVRLSADEGQQGVDASPSFSGGGEVDIDYAYLGYKFANGLKLTAGQFKTALLREELVSDSKQLAVERSFVNSLFTQGYSQGIEIAQELEAWRWFFDFSDGMASANTDFTATDQPPVGQPVPFLVSGQAEYAFTGRLEFMFSGAWKQFEDFTSPKGSDFGFMMGIAGTWQQSTQTQAITDIDSDVFEYTIDASLKGDSWNMYAAFIGRSLENSANAANVTPGADSNYSDFGLIVQGGWRFAENTEVFARWETLFPDSDWGTDLSDTYNFIGFGVNQYYAGHAAKATIDCVWALEQTADLFFTGDMPNTGIGLLGSTGDNEFAIRLQFQLVF